jgi:hypothetical protein
MTHSEYLGDLEHADEEYDQLKKAAGGKSKRAAE